VVALLSPSFVHRNNGKTKENASFAWNYNCIKIHRWGGYVQYPSNMVDLKREEVLFQPSHFIAELHHVLVLCLPNTVHLFRTSKAVRSNKNILLIP
jgi:hypothetical protein